MSFVGALLDEMDSLVTRYAQPTGLYRERHAGTTVRACDPPIHGDGQIRKVDPRTIPVRGWHSFQVSLEKPPELSAVAYGSTDEIVRTLLLFPGSPKYPPGDIGK